MKISKIASVLLAGSIAIFGVGCGSGSSSSDTTSDTTSSTVSGTAVDELIGKGIVKVYAGSVNGKVLATTRTSDNNDSSYGSYSVSINNYKGPIVVEIKCDENSTFKENNGSIVQCDLNTSLYSANLADGGTVITNITPLTTQMVAIATEGNLSKPIDVTALKEAKIKVAYIYGLDPVVTNPVDNSTYTTIINQIHEVADDKNITMDNVIKTFIKDASDGVIGDDDENNLTAELMTSLKGKISSPALEHNETEINLSDINTSIPYDGIYAVKSVVQSLRDNMYSITNEDQNGTLDQEVKDFNDVINRDVIKNTQNELGVLAKIIDATVNSNAEMNGTIVTDNNETYVYNVVADSNNTEFNYTITWNDVNYTGTIKTSQDFKEVNETSDLNSYLFYDINGSLPSVYNKTIQAKAVVRINDDNTFNVTLENVTIKDINDSLTISNVSIDSKYFTYTDDENNTNSDLSYIRFNNIELNAKLDNRFEINGPLSLNWVQNSEIANNYPEGSYQKLSWLGVGVQCIDTNGTHEAPSGGYVLFKLDGKKYKLSPVWYNENWDMGFGAKFENDVVVSIRDYNLYDITNDKNNYDLTNVECKNGYSPKIEYMDSDISEDFSNSGFVPNKIEFNGIVKDLNTSVEMDGKIIVSSDNIQNMNFDKDETPNIKTSLNIVLKRPEYKDTIVNADLTYKSNMTSKLDMSYSFNNNNIIKLQAKWNADHSGQVTVTDLTGVKIVVPVNTDGDPVYDSSLIEFDGEKVGKLEDRGDSLFVIHFNNGEVISLY